MQIGNTTVLLFSSEKITGSPTTRRVFAAGPWRRHLTVSIHTDLIGEDSYAELVALLSDEMRLVRDRLPLIGTLGATVTAVCGVWLISLIIGLLRLQA